MILRSENLTRTSFGKPIAAMLGEFQRRWNTAACCELAGNSGCTGQDQDACVGIAVNLGTRPAYGHYVAQRIQAGADGSVRRLWRGARIQGVFRELVGETEPSSAWTAGIERICK